MKTSQILEWFEDLEREIPSPKEGRSSTSKSEIDDMWYWVLEVQAALEVILRPRHVFRRESAQTLPKLLRFGKSG